MCLSQEKIECRRNVGFQVLAMDNRVEEPVLQKKFGPLKTFGKLLPHGLFDDTRPGKSNQRARLGNIEVAQHGIACSDAASRGVGEDRNKRQSVLIEARESGRNFCEL